MEQKSFDFENKNGTNKTLNFFLEPGTCDADGVAFFDALMIPDVRFELSVQVT